MSALLPAAPAATGTAGRRDGQVFDLEAPGERPALLTPEGAVTYRELADRTRAFAAEVLGPGRRLLLLEGGTALETVVAYLAAVQHGHVALLVPDGRPDLTESFVHSYDPDVVLSRAAAGWTVTQRRTGSAHRLHPDLALLLSTSGSTGSPKLVRLSHDNLRSNADSIASYLGITGSDRAATSLPLHYCYGLSVLNSHLVRGASLVLTDRSVVDPAFWDDAARHRITSFAGVPYTFELLDRSGFADRQLPSLRYVTQAGGRMAPEQVQHWARVGRTRGWDLVVMYGATEATARMAYLPPELAEEHPDAVGVAVPGGTLRLAPVPESEDPAVGELVYTGPNVMLGYAHGPADLADGRTVTELRTGDLARVEAGLHHIVGRRDRVAKLFGLRIDLDGLEGLVDDVAPGVRCVKAGDTLHAFTDRPRAAGRLAARLAAACGLPRSAVRVTVLAELPRTRNGKPDYAALQRHAQLLDASETPDAPPGPPTAHALRNDFATVLGRPDATEDDSFTRLGGDSLSYVELATRLARRLGRVPEDWHLRSVRELADRADLADRAARAARADRADRTDRTDRTDRAGRSRPGRRWTVHSETALALRAVAIVLVVGTHANLFAVMGGAHLLLVLAGHNLARFQLADVPRPTRLRNGLAALLTVAVPSTLVIGGLSLVTGRYDLSTALFLNGLLGSDRWTDDWVFWFMEALVWSTAVVIAAMAIPAVDRWERRAPFAFAAGVLAVTLAGRFALAGLQAGPVERYSTPVVACCVALGWAAARARSRAQRLLVLAAGVVAMTGFFGDRSRELLVVGGLAALLWVPTVALPRLLSPVVATVAGASLWVYLTHWQVYPPLETDHPLLATLASFAVGVACWQIARPALRRLGTVVRGTRPRGHSTGRPRPRAMSMRCTSEVPSPISSTLASR